MLKQVLKYNQKTILFYLINGIIQIIAASLAVVYFQKLLDKIITIDTFKPVLTILFIYGSLLILSSVLSYIDEYPMRILSNGIYQKFKLLALEKVSRVDYAAYQNVGTGQLVQTIENGASAGKNILFDFHLENFRELIPTVVINLIIIGIYNLKIMIAISIGYVFIFIASNILLKYLYRLKRNILTHEENFSKFSIRGFMELVVFRINKRFNKEINKLTDISNHIVKSKAKIRMIHELFFFLFDLLVIAIKLVIIYTGIKQIIAGHTTIGVIVALITFTDRIYIPIAIFNVKYISLKLDKVAYKRYLDFMNLPDDQNLVNGKNITLTNGTIVFDHVDFQYGTRPILQDLSFTIDGKTSTAFVGASGAGKSTIIKIILGLLKPTSGAVWVDEMNLSEVFLNQYYEYVSYVSQDAPIFDGTLRENIVFDDAVSDEKINEILKLVKLHEFVDNLPEGLNTQVGEKGIKLSGGEKQRLAFARVFFQKSKIVIFDEPTSALDSLSEAYITDNMLNVLKDRTILIIAHRLQTVQAVDDIIVIEDGSIQERGSFNQLLKNQGLFHKLWKTQTSLIQK